MDPHLHRPSSSAEATTRTPIDLSRQSPTHQLSRCYDQYEATAKPASRRICTIANIFDGDQQLDLESYKSHLLSTSAFIQVFANSLIDRILTDLTAKGISELRALFNEATLDDNSTVPVCAGSLEEAVHLVLAHIFGSRHMSCFRSHRVLPSEGP